MRSIMLRDRSATAAVSAPALLLGALGLALVAIAGLRANPGVGAEFPIPKAKMSATGQVVPAKLPRSHPAPVTLQLGFASEALSEPKTPGLSRIAIEISRNVTLQTTGLPSCPLAKLSSTYASAHQRCAGSLVGHGSVTSEVALPGKAPVSLTGRLLAFYAFAQGSPHILAQVTTDAPLPLIYVIPFKIESTHGSFGTSLVVPKMRNIRGKCRSRYPNCFARPYTLKGVYGHISKFELSLRRSFTGAGKRRNFVSAECPTRGRMTAASFPLTKVSLSYENGLLLSGVVVRRCTI